MSYNHHIHYLDACIKVAEENVLAAQEMERRNRAERDELIQERDEFLKRQAMLRHPAGKAHA